VVAGDKFEFVLAEHAPRRQIAALLDQPKALAFRPPLFQLDGLPALKRCRLAACKYLLQWPLQGVAHLRQLMVGASGAVRGGRCHQAVDLRRGGALHP
jgi:hypothetical protein